MGRKSSKGPGGKGRKDSSIFRVAGSKTLKAKNKAKAVSTNLKKLNLNNKSKTEKADADFRSLKQNLVEQGKPAKAKPPQKKKVTAPSVSRIDMDAAMENFSKL